MARTKMTPAETKAAHREAKANSRLAKTAVATAQKVFLLDPSKETGKAYREAVSAHITVGLAEMKAAERVFNLG